MTLPWRTKPQQIWPPELNTTNIFLRTNESLTTGILTLKITRRTRIRKLLLRENGDAKSVEKSDLKKITLSLMRNFSIRGRIVQIITNLVLIVVKVMAQRPQVIQKIKLKPCLMANFCKHTWKSHLTRLCERVDALEKFLCKEK